MQKPVVGFVFSGVYLLPFLPQLLRVGDVLQYYLLLVWTKCLSNIKHTTESAHQFILWPFSKYEGSGYTLCLTHDYRIVQYPYSGYSVNLSD